MENMNKCPGCSQHCDRNNLQCGKGEAIFRGEITPDSQHSHAHPGGKCCGHQGGKHQGHCGGKHHSHHRPEFPEGSLADLLAKCGHRLFHGGDAIFDALSEAEAAQLKQLLGKLLAE